MVMQVRLIAFFADVPQNLCWGSSQHRRGDKKQPHGRHHKDSCSFALFCLFEASVFLVLTRALASFEDERLAAGRADYNAFETGWAPLGGPALQPLGLS